MKKIFNLIIFTAFFVLVFATGYLLCNDTAYTPDLKVVVEHNGTKETIDIWQDANGNFYAFLPSYSKNTSAKLYADTTADIYIDNQLVSNGVNCSAYQPDTPYSISIDGMDSAEKNTITFMYSSDIPAMFIDTPTGSMEYIHNEKGNKENVRLVLYSHSGELLHSDSTVEMNGRGNNTWESFDKKPYSITLSSPADLLSMGDAQEWILLANAADPSHIRNKTVYGFSQLVGMKYTPDSQFVDLYLNGEYAGLYQLCERNEVHPNRVDISHNDSFLVSLEMEDRLQSKNLKYIKTNSRQTFRVHYPQTLDTNAEKSLLDLLQSIENAILSEDGTDNMTARKWYELIDVNSWATKYLIEEIFGNGDACRISQYFYYDNDTANMVAGPVWDYDRTQGNNIAWQFARPKTLFGNREYIVGNIGSPWFYYLYQNPDFYNLITQLYSTEFLPELEKLYSETIFQYADEIRYSSGMNQVRWAVEKDIDTEVNYIRDYMQQRIDFLSSMWIDNAEYNIVRLDASTGAFYAHYAVLRGESLGELPQMENNEYQNFEGWYYSDTDQPVDVNRPVYEDMEIYARWSDTGNLWLGRITKLIPAGIIGCVFLALLYTTIRRIYDYER